MTFERKLLCGPEDIRSITLECKACGVRVTAPPATPLDSLPRFCPSCKITWLVFDQYQPRESRVYTSQEKLLVALEELRRPRKRLSPEKEKEAEAIGFRILLEFDEPGSGSSGAVTFVRSLQT